MVRLRPATIALLALHAGGGILAVRALAEIWRYRFVVDLIAARVTPSVATFPSWLFLAAMVSVLLLALLRIAAVLRRAWRRQPETNVALQLRGALYTAVLSATGSTFLPSRLTHTRRPSSPSLAARR